MQNQANNEIWRDEKTGLPMHNSHDDEKEIDERGRTACFFHPAKPCDCGIKGYDLPLSAKPTKGDH